MHLCAIDPRTYVYVQYINCTLYVCMYDTRIVYTCVMQAAQLWHAICMFVRKSVLPIVANYKQLLSPSRLPNCSPSASALTILITMPQTWHAKVVAVAVATVAFVALLTSESNNWCTLSTIFLCMLNLVDTAWHSQPDPQGAIN